jgi:hypothetical protein
VAPLAGVRIENTDNNTTTTTSTTTTAYNGISSFLVSHVQGVVCTCKRARGVFPEDILFFAKLLRYLLLR